MPVTIMAVAPAYTCANASRCNMRTRSDSMPIKPAARTDRPDMRAGFQAAITNACTRAYNRAGMAAGSNAVAICIRARADATDMRSRTYTVLASMRIKAHAQYFNIRAGSVCRDRR